MASLYLSVADVDAAIGSTRRQNLFATETGTYLTADYTRVVQYSSALVKAAAQNAGYSLGDTTTDDVVVTASLGQFLKMAYGRKGGEVPDQWDSAVALLEAIRTGAVPIPSLTPSTRDGSGGSVFTESSTSITNSSRQIFSRREQNVY